MNTDYERYLKDDAFRDSLLEAARRERAKAVAGFFVGLFRSPENKARHDGCHSHLAGQG